jgi:ABC-2 type transport system permease protein
MNATDRDEVRPSAALAAWALGKREIVRFFRQRNRIVGAIGTPLVFWILFGLGFHNSFTLGTANGPRFAEFSFPGSVMLIVMFTAIFTTISVIEDRREGFLQSVLVAPVRPWGMVLGKVWGGAAIAVVQALCFLPLAATFHAAPGLIDCLQLVVLLCVASLGLTAFGFLFAWNTESTQGFHAIMNLVLMPMWLLSGGFFPAPNLSATSGWMDIVVHWAVRLNPLSYAVAGVRRLLFGDVDYGSAWVPSLSVCWLVTLLFAAATIAGACAVSNRRTTGDLL